MASREAGRPSGGHRRPTGGLLAARRAFVKLARCPRTGGRGSVELARRPCGGIIRILRRLSEPWPPEGGSASLEAMGGGVHDGIGTLPDGIGLCPLARTPARAGNGGTGSPPVRGHRQNFLKALRAAGGPSVAYGGWLGLSGGYGRRGARRNKGIARRNRALPARDRARKGWERWNWLAARAGASKFYEGSPRRREASGGWLGLPAGQGRRGARQNKGVARRNKALPARDRARKGCARWGHGGTGSPPVRGIVRILRKLSELPGGRRWPPEGGSASLEAMGGGVHEGIGALPVRILLRLSEPPGGLARRPCGVIVRILRRLSEPPGYTTE